MRSLSSDARRVLATDFIFILPTPIKVIQDTWILILYPFYNCGGIDVGLFWQVFGSLQRVAVGYILAGIVGISVGILIGLNPKISNGLDPIFQILRTVPPLAWVPLALAALKQNQPAALFVIFITAVMSGILGIGFFIWNAYQNGQVSEIILSLIYIGLVGWTFDKLMAWIQTLILPESQRQ